MKLKSILISFFFISCIALYSQQITLNSPNRKIWVELFNTQNNEVGSWYLKINYLGDRIISEIIPQIDLGISRTDQDFSKELKFLKANKPLLINEKYTAIHGKRSISTNQANEIIINFENPYKSKLNLILRAYNDGVAFRYEFPEKGESFVVNEEFTAYTIPENTKRWLEKWNPANEALYSTLTNDSIQQSWCYPALFNSTGSNYWYLLHEADIDRNYCGSKLSNTIERSQYKIIFPDQRDGNGLGESKPTITLPWESPWRVIIIGTLVDIVESTLVDDVSTPSKITKTDWIKPGIASWNYWSNNHGTKDYRIVCAFADLAAAMNWPYTLLDWEWDAMGNGGNLEDAIRYIHSSGVKPLMWYNSGGLHTGVRSTPRDRMLTHENRVEEFTKLKKIGVAGVKIDFFESEK